MLEATATPTGMLTEPMLMPTNFSDAWWVLSSIATLVLLAIVVFFLKRLVDRHDKMNESLVRLLIDQKGVATTLYDHVRDKNVHCRGFDCLYREGGRRPYDPPVDLRGEGK